MGVEGFFKILASHHVGRKPKGVEYATIEQLGVPTTLKSLAGKRVCIDATYMIYNCILAMQHVSSLTNKHKEPTAHINTIFAKIIQLASADVSQLWVFDSPNPNELKRTAYEKRAERKKQAEAKNYENKEKIKFSVGTKHVQQIQKLLRLMGVSYVVAPDGVEAEQYGAYLTKGSRPFCQYVITGDSDVLCFGGNLLRIKQEKTAGGSSRTAYYAYHLEELLAHMQLTYEDFLKVCVTCGTDFADGTPGVGPRTVVEKIRSGNAYITPRQEIVMEYYSSDIVDKIGGANIISSQLDESGVTTFLVKKKGFNHDRIVKNLATYKQAISSD